MKVLAISFLYSDIQIPINTSHNMGLLKQTWRFNLFCMLAVLVSVHLLKEKQCLLRKLYLRSENDPAKQMHAVTHKNENMNDKKEREKLKC